MIILAIYINVMSSWALIGLIIGALVAAWLLGLLITAICWGHPEVDEKWQKHQPPIFWW